MALPVLMILFVIRPSEDRRHFLPAVLGNRRIKILLAGKGPIQRRLRHAKTIGYLLHRGPVVTFPEKEAVG